MKTVRVKLDPTMPDTFPKGRVDKRHLDTTSEQDIAQQQRIDNDEALQDAARFARRVRKRLGLTQLEFSERILFPSTPSATGNRASDVRPVPPRPCSRCWTRPRKPHYESSADNQNRPRRLETGDLKHLIASLLPAPLYRNLVDLVTRRRSVRI